MEKWSPENISDLSGKVVVITGATSGIGKQTARILAENNAEVVLAIRDMEKGKQTQLDLKKNYSSAQVKLLHLDLSNLSSVETCARNFIAQYDRLDLLINNAGVMACPFDLTEDGLEMQIGVNHFGHFALTGLLMPALKQTKDSRVVVVSSLAHRMGKLDFDDLNWSKRSYATSKAYADSKLANLYFAYELARKGKSDPEIPMVLAAHPGWTATDLQRHSSVFSKLNPLFGQSVEKGALPTLRAATDPAARSMDYYGPSGLMELRGRPVKVTSSKQSHDRSKAKRLWELSETLTGVVY